MFAARSLPAKKKWMAVMKEAIDDLNKPPPAGMYMGCLVLLDFEILLLQLSCV